jgi:hypothetical protein
MSNTINEATNTVLNEIDLVIESLKSGHAISAYGAYLDFKGDVVRLNIPDYNAACSLLWYGIEDAGFQLKSETALCENAGFQLAW